MIIFTHHTGEPHGLLGPRVAATFFQQKLSIGIERDFSKDQLLHFIDEYYSGSNKVVAFSHLCGRKDLIGLMQELKQEGFMTILGGPQARQDYNGEPEANTHPQSFRGLKSIVDIAFQGPVDGFRSENLRKRGALLETPWTNKIFLEVDWSNLYTFSDTVKRLEVRLGQVLHAIGCPYASKLQTVTLPPPVNLLERKVPELPVRNQGFSVMFLGTRGTTAP